MALLCSSKIVLRKSCGKRINIAVLYVDMRGGHGHIYAFSGMVALPSKNNESCRSLYHFGQSDKLYLDKGYITTQ